MKILVIDDEPLARKRIFRLLNEKGIKKNIHEGSSGIEAIALINEINPDLVFLDIQMSDMTGFEVLRSVNFKRLPIVIFVTAFDFFAVKAFEIKAFDFLLKPFKKERFFDSLKRAIIQNEQSKNHEFRTRISELIKFLDNETPSLFNSKENYLKNIVLKTNNKYSFIPTEEIKHILSITYYAEIFLIDNKKHLFRISSMTDLMNSLDPNNFIRINRSTIIKIYEIKNVISEGMGDYSIIMKDKNAFSLSKKYRNEFLKKMYIKR